MNLWVPWSGQVVRFVAWAEYCHGTERIWEGAADALVGFNHEKRGIRESGFADDAAWGQTRCSRIKKAAASCRTPSASRLPTPTASAAVQVPPLAGFKYALIEQYHI